MEYRKSKQREQILKLLKSTDTHPTANWLFDKLKKDFPNLSLGTIYRNLNILLEQKLIKKIEFGSTFDRFDSNTSEHHHFICEKCNSIKDITLPDNKDLYDKVNKMINGKTKRHRIEFYGLCEKCYK
jgi:Fur family peroxide stress response transcriptional regulator